MTTTAMMKTKAAVMDPTMSGSCSCHDFGGSAIGVNWNTVSPLGVNRKKSDTNNKQKRRFCVTYFADWC